jgi:HNH endonuclease
MLIERVQAMKPKDVIRFWSKVPIGADGCWEWTAGRFSTGYGAFWCDMQLHGAHRVAYELAHGPVPEGLWVLHHCDNPPCVNPEHLHVGTPGLNVAEREARGRRPNTPLKTRCAQGHELAGDNLRIVGDRRRCVTCSRTKARESWRRKHGKDIKYRAH